MNTFWKSIAVVAIISLIMMIVGCFVLAPIGASAGTIIGAIGYLLFAGVACVGLIGVAHAIITDKIK